MDGWAVVLDHDLADTDYPPKGTSPATDARAWLMDREAFDLQDSRLRLELENTSESTISVVGIGARVESRAAPLSGAIIRSASAGERAAIPIELRLDDELPLARSPDGSPYFSHHFIELAPGELQVVNVTARARLSAVEWTIEVTCVHDGARFTLDVAGERGAFRTAASAPSASEFEWVWFEHPAHLQPAKRHAR